jgi:hypothetical protein
MATKFVTWNIQLRQQHANKEVVQKLQEFLAEAAWEADCEEVAFMNDKDHKTVRMGIPVHDDSGLALLEAAALMGRCESEYQHSKIDYGYCFWKSINAEDGSVVETAYI